VGGVACTAGLGEELQLEALFGSYLCLNQAVVSGHAQSAFYTLLLAGGWMVWRVLRINSEQNQTLLN